MSDADPKPKLRWWQFRRRWLRFSLRAFLILLTVGCVGLGWLANRANKQRQTVQWVEEMEGAIFYDFEVNEYGHTFPDSEPPGPDWLRNLIGIDYFANIVKVNLHDTKVHEVTPLANLANLEFLALQRTAVRDLTPLANLRNLKVLVVSYSPIHDLGALADKVTLEQLFLNHTSVIDLVPLAKLTRLRALVLDGMPVYDLTPLSRLNGLEYLYLRDTPVSDLTPLARLVNLKQLKIRDTQVSREGYETLKRSLPKLAICP